MIFLNPSILFLHIPKTGGNYFTNLFIDFSQEKKLLETSLFKMVKIDFQLVVELLNLNIID